MSYNLFSQLLLAAIILMTPAMCGCKAASWLKTRAIAATAVEESIPYQDPNTGYLASVPSFVGQQSSFEQLETATQRALRLDEKNQSLQGQLVERDEQIRTLTDQILQRDVSLDQAKGELTIARADLATVRSQLSRWNVDLKSLFTNVQLMASENKETLDLLSSRLEKVIRENSIPPRDATPKQPDH